MTRKPCIGKKLKAWRLKNKISIYHICKSEGNGLRPERLKIIEDSDGGTAWALLRYLHFAYVHGYRVLDDIYNEELARKKKIYHEVKELAEKDPEYREAIKLVAKDFSQNNKHHNYD